MSVTNYFIIEKRNKDIESGLEECFITLVNLAMRNSFGLHLNKLDYKSYLLEELNVTYDYFIISDDFHYYNSDEIFCNEEIYEKIKLLPSKESAIKERELLLKKYEFLDEIIEILFKHQNIKSIDFYVSNSEAVISDYKQNSVGNRKLSEAFVARLYPTKGNRDENYFGLKTTKFTINSF